MKRRNAGFTLVELMVVLGITGVMVVMGVMGYNSGMYREYGLSQQMRSTVNALHMAQWRALQNKTSVEISTGTSTGTVMKPGDWYPEITFVTSTDHGFSNGDIVAFANLTAHTALNVGRYYVNVDPAKPKEFTIDWYTQVEPTKVDVPPVPPSTDPVPVAINTRASSQLVLMKRSYVNAQTSTEQAKIMNDPKNLIYEDSKLLIWDATDTTLNVAAVEAYDYQVTVAFDYRGMPTNQGGYQLAVGKVPANLKVLKLITVSPTGRIVPGA